MTDRQKEKLFNTIVYFLNNTKNCYKLKLLKLLYFLDFEHYRQTGNSVTGLDYYAWEKGPVPKDIFRSIEDPKLLDGLSDYISTYIEEFESGTGHKTIIKPKKVFDPKLFTKRELDILAKVAEIFLEATSDQMTEASHFKSLPWDRAIKEKKLNEKIKYDYVLDNSDSSIKPEIIMENNKLKEETIGFINSL